MAEDPILPRPAVMSLGLIQKWLGPQGVKEFRYAGAVQSGRRMMLEAVEDAIRKRYPDGNYPPVEELMRVEDK